jgi:hypothetical protein
LLNITNEVVNSNSTIPHTNTNTKTNNIGGEAPTRKKKEFKPPTKEDIKNYILEKIESGKAEYKNVDVDTFYDYYTESDWHMSNGRKIKSWKQCLVTWANREWNKKQVISTDNRPDIPYTSELIARDKELYSC